MIFRPECYRFTTSRYPWHWPLSLYLEAVDVQMYKSDCAVGDLQSNQLLGTAPATGHTYTASISVLYGIDDPGTQELESD